MKKRTPSLYLSQDKKKKKGKKEVLDNWIPCKKVALLGSAGGLIAQENNCIGQTPSSLHRGHLWKTKSATATTAHTVQGQKIGVICFIAYKVLYSKFMILGFI